MPAVKLPAPFSAWRLFPLSAVLISGCGLRPLVVRQTAALLNQGKGAIYDEPDTAFAREAFPAQLKLLEELLYNDPDNEDLLVLASQGFAGYGFLFLEDSDPVRAGRFYRRGRDYALRALARDPAFKGFEDDAIARAEGALKKASKADVPALFWAAFNWAEWINLHKDSPAALADLPKVVAAMRRVRELDPGFNFAGPEIFFGVYNSRAPVLGGNPPKAKESFDQALNLTRGRYLMIYVLEAQFYAVTIQDEALFKSLLEKVKNAPAGALAGSMLTDQVAKERAARLLEKTDELF